MAETFLTVRTEVLAGGLSRLGTSVVNRLINDAYSWLVRMYLWPFREATVTGPAPLTIADLGAVASVVDTANNNNRLPHRNREGLVERYGDLATVGTPTCWYIENGSVIRTFPVGGTLSVRYYKQPAALVADGDALIVPDAWVQLVIDRARYRGFLRLTDWAGANALRAEITEALQDMVVDQLSQQISDPDTVIVYGGEGR